MIEGKPEPIDPSQLTVKTLALGDRKDLDDLEDLELMTYGRAAQNVWGLVPMIAHGRVFLARLATPPAPPEAVAWCILNADWHDRTAAYLWSFAVVQQHHYRGIGTRLLAHVLDVLPREGFCRVEVVVSPSNARAVPLATSAGFERAAVLPEYFGPSEDRWLFVKRLATEA